MTWEIALTKGLAARVVVARDVETKDVGLILASHLVKGHAVVVTRSDSTPEAKRAKWEEDFYDIDRAGRRRRRYRKTQVEREWEEFFAQYKRDARGDKKLVKDGNLSCPRCTKTWSRLAPPDFDHRCDNPEREDDLTWN